MQPDQNPSSQVAVASCPVSAQEIMASQALMMKVVTGQKQVGHWLIVPPNVTLSFRTVFRLVPFVQHIPHGVA